MDRSYRVTLFCGATPLLLGCSIFIAYTVVVVNGSELPLDEVQVGGGGCDVLFGSIPPQGIIRRSFWIQHDGTLQFHAISGAIAYDLGDFGGYVTDGQGGQRTVTVNSDGTIHVTDEHRESWSQNAPKP
jgi:hypothetical protein